MLEADKSRHTVSDTDTVDTDTTYSTTFEIIETKAGIVSNDDFFSTDTLLHHTLTETTPFNYIDTRICLAYLEQLSSAGEKLRINGRSIGPVFRYSAAGIRAQMQMMGNSYWYAWLTDFNGSTFDGLAVARSLSKAGKIYAYSLE
jgi:hypothetical protein